MNSIVNWNNYSSISMVLRNKSSMDNMTKCNNSSTSSMILCSKSGIVSMVSQNVIATGMGMCAVVLAQLAR